MTIGLLGGTYDPPHLAHVGAAEFVLEHGYVDRVFVVPVFSHAFSKAPCSPFEDRVEMCRLAFSHLTGAVVLELERDLPSPSYTIATVRALMSLYPSESFRLLMGSDVVSDLPRWHDSAELIRLSPPLVLAREGYPYDGALPAALPHIASTDLRRDLKALYARPDDPSVRSRLRSFLPPLVLQYILEKSLYRE